MSRLLPPRGGGYKAKSKRSGQNALVGARKVNGNFVQQRGDRTIVVLPKAPKSPGGTSRAK